MPIIDSMEWMLHATKLGAPAVARLKMFDDEVISAQLSFRDFQRALKDLESYAGPNVNRTARAEMFHHAKVFVLVVRRIGRLGEDMSRYRADFGVVAADAIKLAWKKKKSFFDSFIRPRDAIEHIEGEMQGSKTTWVMMNMVNVTLQVTDDPKHHIDITDANLNAVVNFRNDAVSAVLSQSAPSDRGQPPKT